MSKSLIEFVALVVVKMTFYGVFIAGVAYAIFAPFGWWPL